MIRLLRFEQYAVVAWHETDPVMVSSLHTLRGATGRMIWLIAKHGREQFR